MASYDAEISDSEKVNIASEFILNAPPGEFNEVFNDVRVLLNNDQLLKEGASAAFVKHNRDQFIQTELPNGTKTLITAHGEIDSGTYLDPRSGECFSFDHLRKTATDLRPANVEVIASNERVAVEEVVDKFVSDHYPEGASAVYGLNVRGQRIVVACIEGHKFNPNNFWNGRWRSEWSWNLESKQLTGKLKVQVHYYEDGNVQLQAHKEITESAKNAAEIGDIMKRVETEYQNGINENYATMSETTFKALRRALPITKSKLDWSKICNYKVGKELRG